MTEASVIAAALLFLTVLVWLVGSGFKAADRIDIDDVSELKAPYDSVRLLRGMSERFGLGFEELLAVYLVENRFFPERASPQDEEALERRYLIDYGETVRGYGDRLAPYIELLGRAMADIKEFPLQASQTESADYVYGDGFSLDEGHMGIDIYGRNNMPGSLALVSVCEGYVERTGNNRTDGLYVVVGTDAGSSVFYRHLDTLAEGIAEGARVAAGQELGRMGDSGTECAAGGMTVRLHIGYMLRTENWGELWLNPYIFLRLAEELRYDGDYYRHRRFSG
jgi:murein DD-endopeptidase MepM/ murein hydrolase activator NlpD